MMDVSPNDGVMGGGRASRLVRGEDKMVVEAEEAPRCLGVSVVGKVRVGESFGGNA